MRSLPASLLLALDVIALVCGLLALGWLSRATRYARYLPGAAVALSIGVAFFAFRASEPVWLFSDFHKAYYPAAKAALADADAVALTLEKGVSGFVNLPILAYVFAPLALLPENWAAGLFALIGLGVMFAAWLLLADLAGLTGSRVWLLLFLFAANGPLHNSFREGNTTHILLLALIAGLFWLRAGRQVSAGLVLGAASLIKPPLLLFGAYFVLRGKWRAIGAFSAICIGAGLLSVLVFGIGLNWHWFDLFVLRSGSAAIGAFNAQSIPGFLARLGSDVGILTSWTPLPVSFLEKALATILMALIVAIAVMASVREPKTNSGDKTKAADLEYLLVVALAVVVSPLSWSHYYAWFLLPIAFLIRPDSPFAKGRAYLIWAIVLLLFPVVLIFKPTSPVLTWLYVNFAVSHFLFGGLLCFAMLAWWRWTLASGVSLNASDQTWPVVRLAG